MIIGINFFQEHGLGDNPTSQELYWTNGSNPEWTILISEPLIHHQDDKLPYALIMDACQGDAVKSGGHGAFQAQIRTDGNFQVIGCAS